MIFNFYILETQRNAFINERYLEEKCSEELRFFDVLRGYTAVSSENKLYEHLQRNDGFISDVWICMRMEFTLSCDKR